MMLVLTFLLSAGLVLSSANLLQNGDFELAIGLNNWICFGDCQGSQVSDAISGSRAMKSANRKGAWQGPLQVLPFNTLRFGEKYAVSGYVKLLPSQTDAEEMFAVTLLHKLADDSYEYQGLATAYKVKAADGWTKLEAEFQLRDYGRSLKELSFYIEGPLAGRDFLSDAFSLTLKSQVGSVTSSQPEMLKNSGFEQALGADNWVCGFECSGTLVNDALEGSKSMKVSNRNLGAWQGPWQELKVSGAGAMQKGGYYHFKGYVKLLPAQGNHNGQSFQVTIRHQKSDGNYEYQGLASVQNLQSSDGWYLLQGSFQLQDFGQNLRALAFYIEGPIAGRDFQVDGFSLKAIPQDGSWRDAANRRIDTLRKSNLVININAPGGSDGVSVKVKQNTHEFGFGTAVASYVLQNNAAYRKWYLDNFEWAVLENDFKWRSTEPREGTMTWYNADEAVKILLANNKRIRGHAIFWAEKRQNPDWVQAISGGSELYGKCMKRVDDILGRYKGKCKHWDVNNEMLPHTFFKDKYGSSKIRYDMFSRARQVDPNTKLFLNEYSVVSDGSRTNAYVNLAREFISNKAPVDGLGAQGHFSDRPNGPVILERLDRLAAVGLPIWVTELDYANADVQTRADGLEDALRAFFSHPSVEGVLFWGFWESQHWRGADASLVNGDSMTPNTAGKMWQRLFHSEWRSTDNYSIATLSSGNENTHEVRVFHGEYTIEITQGGKVIKTQILTVPSSKPKTTVNINI